MEWKYTYQIDQKFIKVSNFYLLAKIRHYVWNCSIRKFMCRSGIIHDNLVRLSSVFNFFHTNFGFELILIK